MGGGERPPIPRGRRVRWAISGAILVVMAAAAAWSGATDALRVCEDATSDGPAACRPMELGDPQVVAGLALAALFLLPDLSRLRFGLFEVERRLDDAARNVERSRESLDQALFQMKASLNQRAKQKVKVEQYLPSDAHLEEVLQRMMAKERMLRGDD